MIATLSFTALTHCSQIDAVHRPHSSLRRTQTPNLVSTVDDEIRRDGNLETETILRKGTSKEDVTIWEQAKSSIFPRPFVELSQELTHPSTALPSLSFSQFSTDRMVHLALVKADLIPQLIITFNPQSLSFTEAVDVHTCLMKIIANPVRLSTPYALRKLAIQDGNEQQAVHKTVLKQVLAPSEQYICHLCANRNSIIEGDQSIYFLELLANILEICPYYQPTMDFVLHLPVFITIPSCLTFFENGSSIWYFLYQMNNAQREWNKQGGEERQKWKTVRGMLRMEGFEDMIEEKLRTVRNLEIGRNIITKSMEWNNLQGMNLPDHDTTPDDRLSLRSSPTPNPTALDGRTRLLLADLSGSSTVNQSDAQRIRTPTPPTSSRQIGNTRTPRNLSFSALNHLPPLFLNAARTRSSGHPQLTILPPLSSSFLSDGVVSLLAVSFHGAKQWHAHNGCQNHPVTPLCRRLKRLLYICRHLKEYPFSFRTRIDDQKT
ncbi:hypothetical protein BLNAU_3353 [Blattamonas nauphoetae]|uniref:Uncharacterized protein n=1 Tax=Blattamonas nauphoetae TaxID=2049346 RepID=A0ABQ9YCR7_9EUKA|nr:hypothetical protein BLNAU_3353 [Blattamonas nauphoetae]